MNLRERTSAESSKLSLPFVLDILFTFVIALSIFVASTPDICRWVLHCPSQSSISKMTWTQKFRASSRKQLMNLHLSLYSGMPFFTCASNHCPWVSSSAFTCLHKPPICYTHSHSSTTTLPFHRPCQFTSCTTKSTTVDWD